MMVLDLGKKYDFDGSLSHSAGAAARMFVVIFDSASSTRSMRNALVTITPTEIFGLENSSTVVGRLSGESKVPIRPEPGLVVEDEVNTVRNRDPSSVTGFWIPCRSGPPVLSEIHYSREPRTQ